VGIWTTKTRNDAKNAKLEAHEVLAASGIFVTFALFAASCSSGSAVERTAVGRPPPNAIEHPPLDAGLLTDNAGT